MRIFNYPEPKIDVVESQDIKIDYKQHLKDVLKTQEALDFEEMVRASELFKRLEALQVGETLSIEDQDYAIVTKKLTKFIAGLNGFVVACPSFIDFLRYIKDLPKEGG